MKPTDTTDLSEILNCSYYDHRTDYVWQYILNNQRERRRDYLCIRNLESFVAMGEMLKCRQYDIPTFMKEWENTEHPGLLECSYNERSGILRLKSRTFTFVYRSRTNEYLFTAYAAVARGCMLKNRETYKKYVKGGLFPITHLVELDEQLYSRYTAALQLEVWRKSPQSKLDIQYCREMVPTIMKDADTRKRQLYIGQRLNIILEGNDRVRIGMVEDYSPEEMYAMPSYPRAAWQQGIQKAFEQLETEYNEEVERTRVELTELSQELTQIALGKAPYDMRILHECYRSSQDSYSRLLICDVFGLREEPRRWSHQHEIAQPYISYVAYIGKGCKKVSRFEGEAFTYEAHKTGDSATITMKDEALAKALNIDMVGMIRITREYRITPEILAEYDEYIMNQYREYLLRQENRQRPQHALLVEALKHIFEVTAPLIAYDGENGSLRSQYELRWEVADDDRLMIQVTLHGRTERQSFTLDDYKSRFRVWWAQLLLTECKLMKEASLHPEDNLSYDIPF